MDSAEQHIHLWGTIMLARALQDESLYITKCCRNVLSRVPQIAAPVCFTRTFVAPKDGAVCLFHGSLPCNSICVLPVKQSL